MKAQIYSIISVEEALACIEAGADHIGVLVTEPGVECPCPATMKTAKDIFDAIGDKAVKVLIPGSEDEQQILEYIKGTGPDIVHLSGAYKSNPEFVKKVKELDPKLKIMQAIGVIGKESVEEAKMRAPYADLLLLDTMIPNEQGGIGAVGVPHDWSLDKEIVDSVDIPVIIAGGLGPDNVVDAIRTVRPYGVDSLTKTSIKDENGKLLCKDIELVREFCRLAHSDI